MTTSLPRARLSISDEPGSFGGAGDLIAVVAPTPGVTEPEMALFGSAKALLDEHDFTQGAAYAALHYAEPSLPVLYVAVPIATAGAISHFSRAGVTGTSIVSAAAGSAGVLEQVDATLTITVGGTVGTDQIAATLTLDGGHVTRPVRIGTATSYVIPSIGVTLSFGTGTLAVGDVVRFRTRPPRMDPADMADVRALLASSNDYSVRTILVIGDLQSEGEIESVRTAAQAYETSNERFVRACVQFRDRRPDAALLPFRGRAQGVSIAFDADADTATLASGTWAALGFTVGDTIVITGTASNNGTYVITVLSSGVLTVAAGFADETTAAGTVTGYATLTFATPANTITRSSGSWLDEGFAVGDTVTVAGTADNNGTFTVSTLSATVMTVSQSLAAEVRGGHLVSATATESKAAHRAAYATAVGNVSGAGARRVDVAYGYGAKVCEITGYRLRRPAAWAASLRDYSYDVHIPSWRVDDGPLAGWTLNDANNDLLEHDERVDGGALAIGATCLRTVNNRPGVYVALAMTRADPATLLSRSHNLDVANIACTVVQAESMGAVGQVLELQANGRSTPASRTRLENRINKKLDIALGNVRGQGPRASSAVWQASPDDILNIPGATINGTLNLLLNGTVEQINTVVRVQSGG